MKDILKFTLSAFLMLATLTLVSVVFIQAFMSDYDWINLLLTVLYSLLVVAAALYEGAQRGAKDCKYRNLMQRQMEEQQKELEEKEFTASVGGGVVKVTVSGKREVTNVELAEEAVDPDDIETLQDLIVAAVNEAMRQVDEASSQSMGKLAGGLGGSLGGLGGGFPF